jgi:hypothetical protein
MSDAAPELYGQYNITSWSRHRGFDLSLYFRATEQGQPRSEFELEIKILNLPSTLTALAQSADLPVPDWRGFGLPYTHGLLDFGFFDECHEYTLTLDGSAQTWLPPLVLGAPGFGGDPDRLARFHILRALHRARRDLPRAYKAKKLDLVGACLVLQIGADQLEYNIGILEEKGWIAAGLTFGPGGLYITDDGIQALDDMSRPARPEWQTRQPPEQVAKRIPEIIEMVEAWIPKKGYRGEEAYQAALAEYLEGHGVAAPEHQGTSLVDILAAYGVGIEAKLAPDRSGYDRLCGQIMRHLEEHGTVIVLILRPDKRDLLDEYQRRFAGDERVTFIVKG